ncbi:hypothetical protein CDAR_611441 [Caerostris darwini]|uniref:Uncharacterized protein n=1 Tax=Caerostris darwini TaxID=1538125 RepID=A0AAV4UQ33_9ARAC|nr:hypothetical protein CDAR_611441 [Caerostris darwini]
MLLLCASRPTIASLNPLRSSTSTEYITHSKILSTTFDRQRRTSDKVIVKDCFLPQSRYWNAWEGVHFCQKSHIGILSNPVPPRSSSYVKLDGLRNPKEDHFHGEKTEEILFSSAQEMLLRCFLGAYFAQQLHIGTPFDPVPPQSASHV